MKQKMIALSRRYLTALRKHLVDSAASLQPALVLGRQAVALGLETLELARIHERAVLSLELSYQKNGWIKRAEMFFAEAITPIVETHRAARQSKVDLNRLKETLRRRTAALAGTNRQLQRGIVRRKSVEAALKKSDNYYTKLLKESLHLQDGMRRLTHQVLATQEDERKILSHELQDEIGQTLLGINVLLLTLKQESHIKTRGLAIKIAGTQQLVLKSAESMRQAARDFSKR